MLGLVVLVGFFPSDMALRCSEDARRVQSQRPRTKLPSSPRGEPSGEVQVLRPTARWLRCLFAGKSDFLSPSLADKGLSFPSKAGAEGRAGMQQAAAEPQLAEPQGATRPRVIGCRRSLLGRCSL